MHLFCQKSFHALDNLFRACYIDSALSPICSGITMRHSHFQFSLFHLFDSLAKYIYMELSPPCHYIMKKITWKI